MMNMKLSVRTETKLSITIAAVVLGFRCIRQNFNYAIVDKAYLDELMLELTSLIGRLE